MADTTYAPSTVPYYTATDYGALSQFGQQQRAQNIADNYGIRPATINEFSQKNGLGIRPWKAGFYALIGGALGGLAGLGILSPITAPAGMVVGALMSMNEDRKKMGNAYDAYLSEFASHARQTQEAQRAAALVPVLQPLLEQAKEKQWAADVAEGRLAAPATGVNSR